MLPVLFNVLFIYGLVNLWVVIIRSFSPLHVLVNPVRGTVN